MRLRRIEEVKISPLGQLLVRPEPLEGAMDAMIYRAGKGLRWDPQEKAFHAAEPDRWEHAELLKHIVRTLADQHGEALQLSESTRWTHVPDEQVAVLRSAIDDGA